LIREDFIECDKKRGKYSNKEAVLELLGKELLAYVPSTIRIGFIDRGGHRAELVDFLVKKIPWLEAYIGSTTINPKAPLVSKSKTAEHYMGQTQLLSEQVADFMGSDSWHLPVDISETYLKQVIAQYYISEVDKYGQPVQRFVSEANDHFRDAENMNFAAVSHLKLDTLLFSNEGIARVQKYFRQRVAHQEAQDNKEPEPVKDAGPKQPGRSNTQQSRRRWSK